MELKDIILNRRSVRSYNGKHISDEDMNEILELGTWAPSGSNLQPWHFVVCRSDESKAKLNKVMELTVPGMEGYLNENFKDNPEIISSTLHFIRTLGGADTCVLAFFEDVYYADADAAMQSVGAAMQNMALAAYEKGIGTCWIVAPILAEKEMCDAFCSTKGRLVCAMTFGYTDKYPTRGPRRRSDRIEII